MRKVAVLIAIAVCGALLLVGASSWYRGQQLCSEGRKEPSASTPRGKALGEEGARLVRAIYRYKREVGLWPQSLNELVPGSASSEETRHWRYEWNYWGEWSLRALPWAQVGYRYAEGRGGWLAGGGDEGLSTAPTATAPARQDEIIDRTVAELRRRIKNESEITSHWRGLVRLLTRAGRYAEARRACEELAASLPECWFVQPMLSCIDALEGKLEDGEKRLRALIQRQPSLGNHYVLFGYFRDTGQTAKAVAVIRAAASLPALADLVVVESDGLSSWGKRAEWLLKDMAGYAYEAKEFQLVLSVADAHDRVTAASGYGSSSGVRAPALLALGRYEEAAIQCRIAQREDQRQRTWPDDINVLMKAILEKDRSFIYRGWRDEPALDLWVKYE